MYFSLNWVRNYSQVGLSGSIANSTVSYHSIVSPLSMEVMNSKLHTGGEIQLSEGTEHLFEPLIRTNTTYSWFSMRYNADGLKNFGKMVLNYLQQSSNIDREMGVHVDELSKQLNAPMAKIKDAIEFLEREGLVYSSIVDYHYKAVGGL
ncbi:uncharacterized protein LOC120181866 [Hibiscus syriacus]|uniref:uncharacterized protein LOC120181866 n=1 Tax=Hibiscus syriacus TaxID=106335 RepID=UPI001922349F|nr:uncharacterized protein LOC120181866 [Hibiscus syriacus]